MQATRRDNGDDAPTILIVHGNGASRDEWAEAFTDPHLDRFSLVAVDLPGFGDTRPVRDFTFESIADELASMLAERSSPAVVLGHSMGGPISVLVAEREPAPAGVLLVEGTLFVDPTDDVVPFADYLADCEADAADPTLARYLLSLRRADPGALEAGQREMIRYARELGIVERFCALPQPRAYVAGDGIAEDDLAPLEQCGVEVHRFPGAGHAVMWDEQEAFYEYLAGWATRVVSTER